MVMAAMNMNFEKYKTMSILDDNRPIIFKYESYWLTYWRGYLMSAEIALSLCAKFYWHNNPSKEMRRDMNDTLHNYIKLGILEFAEQNYDELEKYIPEHNIDYFHWFCTKLIDVFDTKYSPYEIYSWFKNMMTDNEVHDVTR